MGQHKDKTGTTRVSKWLSKVKTIFPDVAGEVADVIMGESPLKAVVDLVTKKKGDNNPDVVKSAETLLIQYEFERDQMEHEAKMFSMEVDDRKDARVNGDQQLQRILAYFSLIGFSVFTLASFFIAYKILVENISVNEFIIMTVSNTNGVFTGLLFTLKDFLFGGSSDNKNK